MVRVITIDDVRALIRKITLESFMGRLADQMIEDFSNWHQFEKMARIATHYPDGVIELMPISSPSHYAFKYVNGHPKNPMHQRQTVAAFGALASVETGYPLMIAEMTLLTALRTAVTSALASRFLAAPQSCDFGMIGTGAQSEFQTLAHYYLCGIKRVHYFDPDTAAMEKFARHLCRYGIETVSHSSAQAVAQASDIITTATAYKGQQALLSLSDVRPGAHINAVGGDCPGKTELDVALLQACKIVVEFMPQTQVEGEIQALDKAECVELADIIGRGKAVRNNKSDITLFDSVGFAIEDYSILRLVYRLARSHHIGHVLDLVPGGADPKDLFASLSPHDSMAV